MSGETGAGEKLKRWRRFMYAYNTAMCLSLGPPMILFQKLPRAILKWPYEDPVMMGIYGTIVTSVGACSAAALRSEKTQERFLPLFLVQMLYKTMTCALLAKELRKKEVEPWGLRLILWFFVAYIAMLAGTAPWKASK
ncbi:hypothetical protein [Candidatus Solincola tengchongensis]|uniref:hypothetical protein n=1 Tax=Candidatus Solincola tengchongensis TaxID=2900693 RepID=UPI00257A3E04|nr:hypothetical protein [Candidatus Solincola tengchongensis]